MSERFEKLRQELEAAQVREVEVNNEKVSVETSLLESVAKLTGQTQTIINAKALSELYVFIKDNSVDENITKIALLLIKDALKEARASFKTQ